MRRAIGYFADLSVVVLAIAALAIFAKKQNLFHLKPAQREAFFTIGKPLPGTGINFSDAGTNIVLVLSTECKFCTASAGFYQQLLRATTQRPDTHMVALFRQDVVKASLYLTSLGVPIDRITVIGSTLQYPDKSLGTPTLLVVGKDGIVSKAWVGKLSENQEAEVFSNLGISRDASSRKTN